MGSGGGGRAGCRCMGKSGYIWQGEGVRADVCGKVNKMGECGASGRMYVEK